MQGRAGARRPRRIRRAGARRAACNVGNPFPIEHEALEIRRSPRAAAPGRAGRRSPQPTDSPRVFRKVAASGGSRDAAGTHPAPRGRRGGAEMSAQPTLAGWENDVPEVTLWELLWAVSEVADDEREVVATVAHMLTSGSVRLVGNVRDRSIRFA
jgi:hypothetical protein